jgi:hypothetical protein
LLIAAIFSLDDGHKRATFRRKIEKHHACGLNRSFCGKLQARTDLKLTVAAAAPSVKVHETINFAPESS